MKIKLTSYEKKNYLLNNKEDFIILKLIKKLETKPLSAEDKIVIQLIRTQLKNSPDDCIIITERCLYTDRFVFAKMSQKL